MKTIGQLISEAKEHVEYLESNLKSLIWSKRFWSDDSTQIEVAIL